MLRQADETEALAAELRHPDYGYIAVRALDDGSIAAMHDLIYTRAIVLGCDRNGYARRFCFEDRALATRRFAELRAEDDEPQGYIARR